MALTEHESKCQVLYTKETCMAAATKAINMIDGFTVDRVDKTTYTIYLKGKMSLFSWGELVEVRIMDIPNNMVEIAVMSTPKVGMSANAPGLYGDMGKNKKNIIRIMNAISDELKKYPESKISIQGNSTNDDVFAKIKKLGELRDAGVISSEEFEIKKKELGSIR